MDQADRRIEFLGKLRDLLIEYGVTVNTELDDCETCVYFSDFPEAVCISTRIDPAELDEAIYVIQHGPRLFYTAKTKQESERDEKRREVLLKLSADLSVWQPLLACCNQH